MVIKENKLKIITILLLVLVFCQLGQAQERNYKRGYGFGLHLQEDMEALSVGTSWWYNWSIKPDAGNQILETYKNYGMEFVPQLWNGSFNEVELRTYLSTHPDVKYLMGFNEPNFKKQANMSPAQVAAIWHRVEAIAADFNLKIVAPALNYSPDAPYYSPFDWMDEWLMECEKIGGCHFDFVNVHCYMNTASAVEWYLSQWKRYGKPIWLTEFCAWDGIETTATLSYQKNYMTQVLPILDNDPDIYRYAWFVGRSFGIPYNSLLGSVGKLTDVGYIYTNQQVPEDPNKVKVTLSVVDKTKGAVTSSAQWPEESAYTWLGNTQNWEALNNMPEGTTSGNYCGMYNGLEGGKLIKTNDAWIWSFTFVPEKGLTYNWNPGIWIDANRTVNSLRKLHEGRNLVFTVNTNGNVSGERTLIIENSTTAIISNDEIPLSIRPKGDYQSQISIFPNPANAIVYVQSPSEIATITIFDMNGMAVLSQGGGNTFSVDNLKNGNYLVRIITSDNGIAVNKLTVNN